MTHLLPPELDGERRKVRDSWDGHLDVLHFWSNMRLLKPPSTSKGLAIALTANALKGDMETYIAKGMNDYIAKPVHRDKLLQVLWKWMGA
jgi:CheY-like chemotaxis protein